MIYILSHFSHVRLFLTPWTVACQVPLSMGFSRQEYWNGLPFLPPGDLPDSGTKPRSPALQADSLLCEQPGKPVVEYSISCAQLSVMSDSLGPHGLYPTRLLCPWNFPGKNTGVGCLLQGASLPGDYTHLLHLLHWQVDSLPLCHLGSLTE